jgi:hypothetical protein
MRKRCGHEQKRRRIVPGKVAGIALAQHCDLHLLLDVPVVSERRMAIEHESAGRPDIDEIGRNAEPVFIKDPPMGGEPVLQHRRVEDTQHETADQERGRNRALRGRHGGIGNQRGHAGSFGRREGALPQL